MFLLDLGAGFRAIFREDAFLVIGAGFAVLSRWRLFSLSSAWRALLS
jgi:hypothetical protein